MPLPNFFVVGAPKAGTTALYRCLIQHPDIFIARIKEPGYFLFGGSPPPIHPGPGGDFQRNKLWWRADDYFQLYTGAEGKRAIGDGTTAYLASPEAAWRIAEHVPQARIVALLRHPAERAHSHYLYMVQKGTEPAATFEEALDDEERRERAGWFVNLRYRYNSYYHRQLAEYYRHFPAAQIRAYLYDDWNGAPQETLRDLFSFLGVDTGFEPELYRSNVTRWPRSRRLAQIAQTPDYMAQRLGRYVPGPVARRGAGWLVAANTRFNVCPSPPLRPDTRARLIDDFRDDVLRLQDLLGRDLRHWLTS